MRHALYERLMPSLERVCVVLLLCAQALFHAGSWSVRARRGAGLDPGILLMGKRAPPPSVAVYSACLLACLLAGDSVTIAS